MKQEFVKRLRKDFAIKSFVLALFSLLLTLGFFCYNLFLGLKYGLIWNYSISIYYLILVFIRAFILICEALWKRKPDEKIRGKRRGLYISECIFLLISDALMILPVILMIQSKRNVEITAIPAIGVAAYTTYKVTVAITNYVKASKRHNLSIQGLKILNLTEAVVSVITLQNTLISVFGDGASMTLLTSYTSAALMLLMVALHLYSMIKRGLLSA